MILTTHYEGQHPVFGCENDGRTTEVTTASDQTAVPPDTLKIVCPMCRKHYLIEAVQGDQVLAESVSNLVEGLGSVTFPPKPGGDTQFEPVHEETDADRHRPDEDPLEARIWPPHTYSGVHQQGDGCTKSGERMVLAERNYGPSISPPIMVQRPCFLCGLPVDLYLMVEPDGSDDWDYDEEPEEGQAEQPSPPGMTGRDVARLLRQVARRPWRCPSKRLGLRCAMPAGHEGRHVRPLRPAKTVTEGSSCVVWFE